jgi:hypothetical protein
VTRFGGADPDADVSSDGSPRSRQCSPPIAAVPLTPMHIYCAPRDSPPILPAKELRSSPGSAIFSRYDVNALTPKVMAQSPSSALVVWRGMDRETPEASVKPRAPSPSRVGPRRRAPGRRHIAVCNAFLSLDGGRRGWGKTAGHPHPYPPLRAYKDRSFQTGQSLWCLSPSPTGRGRG